MSSPSNVSATADHRVRDAIERYGTAMAGLALIIYFLLFAPNFASPANLLNVAKDTSFLAILAIGFALALTIAELDLSVAEIASSCLPAWSGRGVTLGVRPEHLVLGDGVPGRSFEAEVEVVEQLGSEILLETRLAAGRVTAARVPAETVIAPGDRVRLSVQPGRLHFFDPQSEAVIAV